MLSTQNENNVLARYNLSHLPRLGVLDRCPCGCSVIEKRLGKGREYELVRGKVGKVVSGRAELWGRWCEPVCEVRSLSRGFVDSERILEALGLGVSTREERRRGVP